MAPDTPAVPSAAPAVLRLRHARCLFHPLREAAARCPHCGGTFCRECVTDEDDKLACLLILFFSLLQWRVNRPELHLNFGGAAQSRLPGPTHE